MNLFLAVMLAVVLAPGSARAKDMDAIISVNDLPAECRAFTWVPPDVRDDTFAWNQLLSLASCLQDDWIEPMTDAEDLRPSVEDMIRGLAAPTTIYLSALQEAPGPIQLRAAYQLGMAHVALIVRARTAVTDPALRVFLEPLLAPSSRFAFISFSVIDRAVTEDPALASDAVTQTMVRSARAMLTVLPRPDGLPFAVAAWHED